MEKPEDPTKDRYKSYKVGTTEFTLEDYAPNEEECKFILFKVVEQAVRDLVSLENSEEPELIERCREARDFIFDDDYYIAWGDEEFNLQIILDLLGIDLEWFRDKTRKKLTDRDNDDEE